MAQPMPQPKRRGRTLQEAWEEAEAGLAHANLMVDQLRALVGGPRKEELRVAGKDYCRHCGVEIFVPNAGQIRTGPLMHVALVPYRQCKMLTNAQWEDGHEEPAKAARVEVWVRCENCGEEFQGYPSEHIQRRHAKAMVGTYSFVSIERPVS